MTEFNTTRRNFMALATATFASVGLSGCATVQKALDYNKSIQIVLHALKDKSSKDQLKRASQSINLNIAESSSRFSKADRKRFLIISRGSAFECAAILEYLEKCDNIPIDSKLYQILEEISKMIFGIIKKLE